jgi:hypothetical protein
MCELPIHVQNKRAFYAERTRYAPFVDVTRICQSKWARNTLMVVSCMPRQRVVDRGAVP